MRTMVWEKGNVTIREFDTQKIMNANEAAAKKQQFSGR